MKLILVMVGAFLLLVLLGLLLLRWSDQCDDAREWTRLAALQPDSPDDFDESLIAGLPQPVQRFFRYAIAPGTPLYPVAEITMNGDFSLGSKEKPDYQSMSARQILAAPQGFVWQLSLPGVSGSDAAYWTRFRLFGLLPVARFGGTADHTRAAFGRYIAEAVFWTPAALLPGPGVHWEALAEDRIRVTVTFDGLEQAVELVLNQDGQPLQVFFMRWSDANPQKEYRLQPFGGYLSDFREVQGYRIPFHVEAGNMFGTDDYFAFYRADIESVMFR